MELVLASEQCPFGRALPGDVTWPNPPKVAASSTLRDKSSRDVQPQWLELRFALSCMRSLPVFAAGASTRGPTELAEGRFTCLRAFAAACVNPVISYSQQNVLAFLLSMFINLLAHTCIQHCVSVLAKEKDCVSVLAKEKERHLGLEPLGRSFRVTRFIQNHDPNHAEHQTGNFQFEFHTGCRNCRSTPTWI